MENIDNDKMTLKTPNKLADNELLANALDVAVDLLEELQKIIAAGQPKTVKVRFGEKVIAQMPIAVGAVSAVLIGLGAVALSKIAIEIENE